MRKTAAVAAAFSLMAAPAFAQETQQEPNANSAPHSAACKGESKKKNSGGKGKTAFAVCVSGFNRAKAQDERNEQREARGQRPQRRTPGQFCKDQSRKKAEGQKKSAFASCVKGATEYNKTQREAAPTATA